ncbi:hypothetical protein EVJ58_g6244 [Rhodofomes roseus]|uniref:Cytochrome P450 n=1 Tax=Rhodofomes roseus TaxID=34475 RepID=A0A4Y9Y8P1_9APHY|nr:hypothetical protein EVJ58_g6244 [Rhodofomes roseus]
MSEIMEWFTVVLLPYDSESRRRQRKWIQHAFNDKDAIITHEPIRRRETYKLLLSLMQEPEDFVTHVKRFVAAILTEITYGYTITSLDDPWFVLMDKAVQGTGEGGSAAAVLVDFFPIMKHIPSWMPGAGFKRHALAVKEDIRKATHMTYYSVKDALAAGTARPSFAAALIEDAQRNGTLARDELDIMAASSTIYAAGMDTTRVVLITFILAMVLHPEVLRKAQAEVDLVVGADRLPEPDDREKLPYIECLIKETLRWCTPIPLGIPHCLTEDDNYEGYAIPKGSTVLTNIWAMTHDEETYPDAFAFRPERFIGVDSKTADSTDPRAAIFGFGRR